MGIRVMRDWPAGGKENPLESQMENTAAWYSLKLLFKGTGMPPGLRLQAMSLTLHLAYGTASVPSGHRT